MIFSNKRLSVGIITASKEMEYLKPIKLKITEVFGYLHNRHLY